MSDSFNAEQYALIIKCSLEKDFSEWNDYIDNHKGNIRLENACFKNIELIDVRFTREGGIGVVLSGACFENAKLTRVDFSGCNLIGSNFNNSEISNSFFNDASICRSEIKNATLYNVDFPETNFDGSNLENTEFNQCYFYESKFYRTNLKSAKFRNFGYNPLIRKEIKTILCGAIFKDAIFDNNTYFGSSLVSKETDFRAISFESAHYAAGLKQTFQYCNRRHNWNDWYRQNKLPAPFVRFFWWHTDYGYSIKQLIKSLSITIAFFSITYTLFPSLVHGLSPFNPIQSMYFSFSTMTTLGFGDMYASHDSIISQLLIISQVCYGYILLGSLITILSNLFYSDGPPQGLIKHPKRKNFKITFTFK